MTLTQWFIFFLVIQVIHFLGTWKLYVKAGFKAWEAAVPVYNAYILTKIINRHWSWVLLLFIPVINVIMLPIFWVETIRSFGKNTPTDTFLVVATLGFYIFYVNYFLDVEHIKDRSLTPKTAAGEWVSSILFAVVAATIVHTYVMQPYNIPTSSLEKTLLIGDFLFVSKFHYGARAPMTAVSFPMVHDTIPVIKKRSYLKKPQIPYFRLPGFSKIKRSDIVVFSWPVDTVTQFFTRNGIKVTKPIDKKSNYVKRCVGVPGDNLTIVDGKIFIDGKPLDLPEKAKPQYSYNVQTKKPNATVSLKSFYERYDITDPVAFPNGLATRDRQTGPIALKYEQAKAFGIAKFKNLGTTYDISALTEKEAKRFAKRKDVASIERIISPKGEKEPKIFPNNGKLDWNKDQMGPIYIPEEGKSVNLTPENIDFYKRIIEVYEGKEMGIENKVSLNGSQVLINNTPTTSYTFKQDYYWMMGDNRHNSEDSRYWGFVPENHVVGKPVFLFMSWDTNAKGFFNKIRWNRIMTTVGGDGKLVSYRYLVLALILAYMGISFFLKKRKEKQA
ncbi:signal peptidase I [Aquimarina agarilytica]|uniref:signal peptidase I n=1 Tax=Aquimarina agarilytica TaxID=1087449 RepID=UPI0002890BBE|nr:signal peptidase I [Aquimarina agarilytica]